MRSIIGKSVRDYDSVSIFDHFFSSAVDRIKSSHQPNSVQMLNGNRKILVQKFTLETLPRFQSKGVEMVELASLQI